MADDEYEIPNDDGVAAEDIQPGADLTRANLSGARLTGADLSNANLFQVDLSNAELVDIDLSEAGLLDAKLSGSDLGYADLSNADLKQADLEGVEMNEVDLSGASLFNSNLSGSGLHDINFTGANLSEADLSEATLSKTDCSEADLYRAVCDEATFFDSNLSGAELAGASLRASHLFEADLSETNLSGADLSDAELTGADLTDAILWNTSLSGALISRNTSIDSPGEQIKQTAKEREGEELSEPVDWWDAVARANHELKTVYSENGLISQARKARVRERRARRKEAKAEDGWRGTAAWAGSLASRFVTGYGVQIWPVTLLMILLWLGSAAVYTLHGGIGWYDSLYFSIVTFTTSPPPEPALSGISRFVAGVETFLGTTAIVFLGYVLGTRERV